MIRRRSLQIGMIVAALLGVVVSCSSCSPGYVLRGAYEEAKILAQRQNIDVVIADPATSAEERRKLTVVKEARTFAMFMQLTPKQSFTKYTRLDKNVLTWVVVGCRPDSFEVATWWYPIVGRMPYKGFFEKEDAEGLAEELRQGGYEASVRGSEAFSTLGWFNDPVLTPTLRQSEYRIAQTVIHESVHATVWIPNNVAFNESLANYVGIEGAAQFFASPVCDNGTCGSLSPEARRSAGENTRKNELLVAAQVEALYQDLSELYKGPASKEEKLAQREAIFTKHVTPLRSAMPKLSILQKMNNAEIVQLILYMTKLHDFEQVYRSSGSWAVFFDKMREIAKNAKCNSSVDPFYELRRQASKVDSNP
jgi:predicted aminopeptidase